MMDEIIKKALCDKIAQQETLIETLRKQIKEMDQCIQSGEKDYRQVCSERDEWRTRALEVEQDAKNG